MSSIEEAFKAAEYNSGLPQQIQNMQVGFLLNSFWCNVLLCNFNVYAILCIALLSNKDNPQVVAFHHCPISSICLIFQLFFFFFLYRFRIPSSVNTGVRKQLWVMLVCLTNIHTPLSTYLFPRRDSCGGQRATVSQTQQVNTLVRRPVLPSTIMLALTTHSTINKGIQQHSLLQLDLSVFTLSHGPV